MNNAKNQSLSDKDTKRQRFARSWLRDIPVTPERLAQSIPFLLFLAFWAVVYIANRHYSEKTERKISHLSNEVKDLRADYLTTKAGLMFETKQSEVSEKVMPLGLKELKNPPKKISVSRK